jgi:hypothetical protein
MPRGGAVRTKEIALCIRLHVVVQDSIQFCRIRLF